MRQITFSRLLPFLLAANFSAGAFGQSSIQFIHEIQGSGPGVVAPGTLATVQAVVIGDYQESDQLRGFFLQEEDADQDSDPQTSEGIFIYCGSCDVAVAEGDIVTVTGEQEEFSGMSQIDVTGAGASVVPVSIGQLDQVTPSMITLPAAAGTTEEATFEAHEGMLVQFSNELTVTEIFQLARYGQLVLSAGGKQRQFTDAAAPSVSGYAAHQDEIARGRIILDDLNNNQNADPVFHPQPGGFSVDNLVRGGDTVSDLTGILHWSWAGSGGTDAWRVRPQLGNPVTFTPGPQRTGEPDPVGGRLKLASVNLLNYFTTIPADRRDPARGADSEAELDRQTTKLVAAMEQIDADVFGVVELENNAVASLNRLVTALNAVVGAGVYEYIDTGIIGTDAIKVGLIYRSATVSPHGVFAILDSSIDPDFNDVKNRPALIQTFTEDSSGQRFTVAVNHLKSKGSPCDDLGDPGLGDGQGNCNLTRTAAIQALVDYLNTDPTASDDPDFLIIGDLNAYAMEDPVTTVLDSGYTNVVAAFAGSAPYSFVFDGQWGYLDHVLATNSLNGQITGATAWHINADEVNLLDYNDTIQDPAEAPFEAKPLSTELYAPGPYRSSDHDPLVVGLSLGFEPADKADCEKGGWRSKSRGDGSGFKNQGSCIRYVNNGK